MTTTTPRSPAIEVTWTPSFTLELDPATGQVRRIVADWMDSLGDTATRSLPDCIEELSSHDLTGPAGAFVRSVTGYDLQQLLKSEPVDFA